MLHSIIAMPLPNQCKHKKKILDSVFILYFFYCKRVECNASDTQDLMLNTLHSKIFSLKIQIYILFGYVIIFCDRNEHSNRGNFFVFIFSINKIVETIEKEE